MPAFWFLLVLASTAFAAEHDDSKWRFSGFANIGLDRGDSSRLGFRRDIVQGHSSRDGEWRADTDSSVGIQLNWQWLPRCDISAQLLLKQRLDADADDLVEWAFLRCRPFDHHQIRAGRLGLDIFMLSDYRPVGYAYPWARPPHDFYAFLSIYRYEGIDYRYQLPWQNRNWSVGTFAGSAKTDKLRSNQHVLTLRAEPLYGFRLAYDDESWHFLFNHTEITLRSSPDLSALSQALAQAEQFGWANASAYMNELLFEDGQIRYDALGFGYDGSLWWAQSEWARLVGDRDTLPNSDSYYFSVGRRFDDLGFYLSYGQIKPRQSAELVAVPDYLPAPLQQALAPVAAGLNDGLLVSRSEQHSWTLGFRWDFSGKQSFKVEYEHFSVAPYGAGLWQSDALLTTTETVNVVSVHWQRVF